MTDYHAYPPDLPSGAPTISAPIPLGVNLADDGPVTLDVTHNVLIHRSGRRGAGLSNLIRTIAAGTEQAHDAITWIASCDAELYGFLAQPQAPQMPDAISIDLRAARVVYAAAQVVDQRLSEHGTVSAPGKPNKIVISEFFPTQERPAIVLITDLNPAPETAKWIEHIAEFGPSVGVYLIYVNQAPQLEMARQFSDTFPQQFGPTIRMTGGLGEAILVDRGTRIDPPSLKIYLTTRRDLVRVVKASQQWRPAGLEPTVAAAITAADWHYPITADYIEHVINEHPNGWTAADLAEVATSPRFGYVPAADIEPLLAQLTDAGRVALVGGRYLPIGGYDSGGGDEFPLRLTSLALSPGASVADLIAFLVAFDESDITLDQLAIVGNPESVGGRELVIFDGSVTGLVFGEGN